MFSDVPVYVISFNNPSHVHNMVQQLKNRRITSDIVIVDNASTYPSMITFLAHAEADGINVLRMSHNYGHRVVYSHVSTPERYVITDPDLQFNDDMPSDVILQLIGIADDRKCRDVGLALQLPEEGLKTLPTYFEGMSLMQWERQFWLRPVESSAYELYLAPTDTTFKLVSKMYSGDNNVRVAGCFACKHMPWYNTPEVTVPAEEYEWYKREQICSTTCRSS